jgi:hypothetical protein
MHLVLGSNQQLRSDPLGWIPDSSVYTYFYLYACSGEGARLLSLLPSPSFFVPKNGEGAQRVSNNFG